MRFVALAVATAALVALTLERARTSRFALGSLWREAFPRHDGTGRKGLHLAWIVAGLAGGAAIVVMPLVAGVMLGAVAIAPTSSMSAALLSRAAVSVVLIVAWAAVEEFVFRGALLAFVRRHTGTTMAIVVSALAFAAAHVGTRAGRFADLASVAVWTVDGVLFAVASVATGSLWFPTALHVGKNLAVWLVVGGSSLALVDGLARVRYLHPSPLVGTEAAAGWLDVCASITAAVIVGVIAARRRDGWAAVSRQR